MLSVDRNSILSEIAKAKDVERACKRVSGNSHLAADLYSEVLLIVCEMKEDKLIELYNKKQLQFFIVRIIINQWTNKNNPFYKKYRCNFVELQTHHGAANECYNYDKDEATEVALVETEKVLKDLKWYDRELFNLYIKDYNNYNAMSRATKIPVVSIFKTIKKVKQTINERVNKHCVSI